MVHRPRLESVRRQTTVEPMPTARLRSRSAIDTDRQIRVADLGSYQVGVGILRRGQDIDMSCPMAAGGFLSTPTELVRFGYAMLNAEVLDSATVEMFLTQQRLASARRQHGYRRPI